MSKLLTLDEAAELLRCGKDQVRAFILDGELKAVPMGRGTQRRSWLIREADLDAFIENRLQSVAPTPARRAVPIPGKKYL